jgi:arylformamidase
MRYLDISRTISVGMKKYPTDPSVKIYSFKSLDRGDSCNLNKLVIGSHTGTHVDAPRHIFKKGCGVDSIKFQNLICDVCVIDIKRFSKKTLLRILNTKEVDGIILKNAKMGLTIEEARILIMKRVRVIGTDEGSIESSCDKFHPVHRLLLESDITIIENLDLRKVKQGDYKLLCLPLKIKNGDGAPARAVLMYD